MYWTVREGHIMRAQMDGSDPVQVVTGLGNPVGITIDYDASRMFWTEHTGNKICSSNLDGTDVRPIVPLPSGTVPWGIAVHNDQIYWGNRNTSSLQRSSKSGQDVRTVFTGSSPIQPLMTSGGNFPTTRRNQCEGHSCANICVIKTSRWWPLSSSSCIP